MAKTSKLPPVRRADDGTLTFGKDDTEHLLSSQANKLRLFSALEEFAAGGYVNVN